MINFVHSNDTSVLENLLIETSKRQMQSNLGKFIITGKVDKDIIQRIKKNIKIDKIDLVHLSNELNICENLFLFFSKENNIELVEWEKTFFLLYSVIEKLKGDTFDNLRYINNLVESFKELDSEEKTNHDISNSLFQFNSFEKKINHRTLYEKVSLQLYQQNTFTNQKILNKLKKIITPEFIDKYNINIFLPTQISLIEAEALKFLSKFITINIFFQCPTKEISMYLDYGIISIADNFILSKFKQKYINTFNNIANLPLNEISAFVHFSPVKSRLEELKNNLLHNNDIDIKNVAFNNGNKVHDNIFIKSYDSKKNEVQGLKQKLLEFKSSSGFDYTDIVVYVCDLNSYSSIIKGLFLGDTAFKSSDIQIVKDKKLNENPETQLYLKLLKIINSNCTIDDFLNIIESSQIKLKFLFSDLDLNLIRKIIKENKISEGISKDISTHNSFTDEHGFLFGLDRALKKLFHPSKIFNISRNEQILLSGVFDRLYYFLRLLLKYQRILNYKRTLTEWTSILEKIAVDFFSHEDDNLAYDNIHNLIDECHCYYQPTIKTYKFSFKVISFVLDKISNNKIKEKVPISKKIIFCDFLSDFTFQKKIICCLGFDNYDNQSFSYSDLYSNNKIIDVIFNAQEYLYISYIKRKKTKLNLPIQLLNYLQLYMSKISLNKTRKDDNQLMSASVKNSISFQLEKIKDRNIKTTVKPNHLELEYSELVRILPSPIKFYLRRKLYFHPESIYKNIISKDDLMITLKEETKISEFIFNEVLNKNSLDVNKVFKMLVDSGHFVDCNYNKNIIKKTYLKVSSLLNKNKYCLENFKTIKLEKLNLCHENQAIILNSVVLRLYDNHIVDFNFKDLKSNKLSYKISIINWINHLIYNAFIEEKDTLIIFYDNTFIIDKVQSIKAKKILYELISYSIDFSNSKIQMPLEYLYDHYDYKNTCVLLVDDFISKFIEDISFEHKDNLNIKENLKMSNFSFYFRGIYKEQLKKNIDRAFELIEIMQVHIHKEKRGFN